MVTKWEIAILVVSSGLAAGLVSGLVTLISGWYERGHRTKERKAVEEHEARLRRELAHDQALPQFLPNAEKFAAWTDKYAHDLHWDEVGDVVYLGTDQPLPSAPAEVLDCLRPIMHGHPSKRVRKHAGSLYDDISAQWSEITGNDIEQADLDQALDWSHRAKALIELIHTPEATPVL